MHVDTGGQTSDGKVSFRINSVGQTGDTYNTDEPVHKYFVGGTTDVHLSDSALLQFDASHSEWNGTIPGLWSLASGVNYSQIAVPDPRSYGASRGLTMRPTTPWEERTFAWISRTT